MILEFKINSYKVQYDVYITKLLNKMNVVWKINIFEDAVEARNINSL